MARLLCYLGRHRWQRGRNPEVGGSAAEYEVCLRCHKERTTYGKPPATGVAGGGWF